MTSEIDKPAVDDIDCLEAIDNLYAYLDGEIEDQAVLEKFETHISHCRSCYSRTEMERELNRRIEQSGKDEVPASLRDRLRDLVEKL